MKEHRDPAIISARAAALSPYTPGEQPRDRRYIKLNTNENPYPPAPAIQEYLRRVDAEELRLYPDPESTALRRALSEHFSLPENFFFLGNGSDEVLSFIFYAFFERSRGKLLFPQHTYSFYPVYCAFYDIPFKKLPLSETFFIDTSDYSQAIRDEEITGIIFPNPNAPTGAALDRKSIENLLDHIPSEIPLVIDEAYVDFGAETCIPLVEKYENLIVVQTFSKNRSLAGMRIGYAMAKPKLIDVLNRVKNSFNSYPLNRMSQEIALRAIQDTKHFEDARRRIMHTREETAQKLSAQGWRVIPSLANFLFASPPKLSGKEVYSHLKERGILVRHFGHPGIEDFLRISIGKDEDMEKLIDALDAILK